LSGWIGVLFLGLAGWLAVTMSMSMGLDHDLDPVFFLYARLK
jgi:hypothetical protein